MSMVITVGVQKFDFGSGVLDICRCDDRVIIRAAHRTDQVIATLTKEEADAVAHFILDAAHSQYPRSVITTMKD